MGKLRVGVLIIGSLYWDGNDDSRSHRKKWRDDRLNMDGKRHVRTPIRYGRQSGSRGDSYTMVFSRCADDSGHAIVIPCSRRVRNATDLVNEAVLLWTAETRDGENSDRRISAKDGWGRVALLENPEHLMSADLRAGWTRESAMRTAILSPRESQLTRRDSLQFLGRNLKTVSMSMSCLRQQRLRISAMDTILPPNRSQPHGLTLERTTLTISIRTEHAGSRRVRTTTSKRA